jgi:bidirectional [NiFe] hydrogenase diaphorase subunit
MILLTIDGKEVKAPEGSTVLEAAARSGIEIPQLCNHEGIRPYGACRLCTVEITQGGRTRLQAACTYPVSAGIEVKTNTARVRRGRRIILEMLLARCPEVRSIRELARKWGVRRTRFETRKMDDCVLCGLCVRACSEVIGAEALGFSGRGVSRAVGIPFGLHPDSCIGCGLCTYVCPTGKMQMEALTAKRLRHDVGTERTCRYMLMGLVSSKTCPENIQCWQCPYDQSMELAASTHPALLSPRAKDLEPVRVGPFELSPDRSYDRRHLWVRGADGLVVVGVDHFLCSLLGPVEDADAADGLIRLVSAGRSLSLPVRGELVRVNPDIRRVPRLVGFSPYRRGWVALVRPEEGWVESLVSGPEAVRWLRREVERLKKLGGMQRGKLDAAGVRRGWKKARKAFFEGED